MTKTQAIEKGLHFTGHYSSTKENMVEKLAIEKAKKPLAKIVLVPEKKGWSIYADEKYSTYEICETLSHAEEEHLYRLKRINEKYNESLAEENKRHSENLTSLTNAQKTLGITN